MDWNDWNPIGRTLPNEDTMNDREIYMATREIDPTNFEPDSAYFAQAQQIVDRKNEELELNKGRFISDKNMLFLTNHYNPRIYKELSYLRSQDPQHKTRAGTRAAQKYLKSTGHYTGEIDGWYGNQTREAIKNYEYEYINQDVAWRLRNWFNKNIKSPLDDMFGGDE